MKQGAKSTVTIKPGDRFRLQFAACLTRFFKAFESERQLRSYRTTDFQVRRKPRRTRMSIGHYKERFEHSHPRVRQRMEVLWLISQGLVYREVSRLAGVSEASVDRDAAIYRQAGLEGVREFKWVSPTSQLMEHRASLEESFLKHPPHTIAEACQRMKVLTGIERRPTQVRAFLKER